MKTIYAADFTRDPMRIIMMTQTYQRKPLTVEAVQVTEANLYEVAKWCEGDVRTHNVTNKKFIQVDVLHPLNPKQTKATVGEWVLKSDQGYKIYSDAAFKKGWELVGEVGRALQEAFEKRPSSEGLDVLE